MSVTLFRASTSTSTSTSTSRSASAGPGEQSVDPVERVRSFHRKIGGYQPTPLLVDTEIGSGFDAEEVLLKLELERFGLPAFKFLGASYAAYRALDALGVLPLRWDTADDLRRHLVGCDLRLVTATDGNHGRALARFASMIGLAAKIHVPTPTADARIEAIVDEGAEVTVVDADYDEAVRVCAAEAAATDVIVSDTSWPGYTMTPRHVVDGYGTIFAELDEQLVEFGLEPPSSLIVPAGVGALAAAAAAWIDRSGGETRLVIVEPTTAACVTAALIAGRPVSLPDSQGSSMAGLNCGTASSIALERLLGRTDASVTVDDDHVMAATKLLAGRDLAVGESAAATIAALTTVGADDPAIARHLFGDRPLALLTEAPTDPNNYRRMVDGDQHRTGRAA